MNAHRPLYSSCYLLEIYEQNPLVENGSITGVCRHLESRQQFAQKAKVCYVRISSEHQQLSINWKPRGFTTFCEAEELEEDLLSIVTVFVARHNGLRSIANRKRGREIIQGREISSREDTTRPSLSYSGLGRARWT
ncbi:8915_t:CDS:2 [Ambispora leptoticha]|uniref:8915_t:CDS:1 n=1 Tax=Ambispora leptoticha TaxID=144679 RepID=A0A9N9FUI0_9GLOM|nr:8915_t:CDS:2 [Ambispora leptoticha]